MLKEIYKRSWSLCDQMLCNVLCVTNIYLKWTGMKELYLLENFDKLPLLTSKVEMFLVNARCVLLDI